MSRKICAVSGGLDPLMIGHVRLIQAAWALGDVIVLLNSDEFLMKKKGYCFLNWNDRAEIIRSLKGVVGVIPVIDTDQTVCETLRILKPDIFANGGDRGLGQIPEESVCTELGIKMVFGVGGTIKISSSSEVVKKAATAIEQMKRSLGEMEITLDYESGINRSNRLEITYEI